MPDYQNSKIYKLVCGDLTYIGSTCETLCRRKAGHKADYKRWNEGKRNYVSSFKIFELDCDNVDIVLIEKFPCEDKMELLKRERYWIENTECVNKYIPSRSSKEYRKEYYEKNKETIKEYLKEYRKEYYEKNKEIIKDYYQKNKEIIKEKKKEKITCECGCVVRKCDLPIHIKSLKHQQYENSI